MLNEMDAIATVAVKDLAKAREFYEKTLGLSRLPGSKEEEAEVAAYATGKSRLFVYRSTFAGTNQATAVTWEVGDRMESLVRALRDKGIAFEHYDMPGMTREGDIHVAGKMKAAWLKDPDGNILALVGR